MKQNTSRSVADDDDDDDDSDDDSLRDKYLTFRIGNEYYALPIAQVVEIVGIMPVTEVADLPTFIRGVLNLRGRVIPAIDVRLRFGMKPREDDPRTCIIIVELATVVVGLIVDTVSEVLVIPEDHIAAAPTIQNGKQSRFVRGFGRVGESVKIILDLEKLLHDSETVLNAASLISDQAP